MWTRSRLATVAAAVALSALTGCPRSESPAADTTTSAAGDSTARVASAAWYERTRTLDLTGDGIADSIRLEARGVRTDSLRIALRLLVDGAEAHREEWGSSYELALVDSAIRTGPQADSVLRARLDSVLGSVRVQRFGSPGARPMLEDSAALRGLDPRPTHQVSFSYGYESTARLVWDAPRRRFVQLWSCC